MTYKLTFLESAKREWDKLSPEIQKQFKNKLKNRLENPLVDKDKLHHLKNCYKIKLRSVGYRLVYYVHESRITVQVVAVGKRDKNFVYQKALHRLNYE